MGVVGAVGHPGAQEDIAHLSLGHRLETPAWSGAQSYNNNFYYGSTWQLIWLSRLNIYINNDLSKNIEKTSCNEFSDIS